MLRSYSRAGDWSIQDGMGSSIHLSFQQEYHGVNGKQLPH